MSDDGIFIIVYGLVVIIGLLVLGYHDANCDPKDEWGEFAVVVICSWMFVVPLLFLFVALALMFWTFKIIYMGLIIIMTKFKKE